jgi:predicted permease
MSAVLPTLVPVFGLVVLGWAAGRLGYLSEAAIKGLPEFVFRIAMPVMLVKTIGGATLPDVAPGALLGAFFGAMAVTWALAALLTAVPLQRPQTDGAALGMGATFSNTVMMGIPICLAHFGAEAASILALIILVDTPLLWFIATMHLALAEGRAGGAFSARMTQIAWRLGTNPIILGVVGGLLLQVSGAGLPPLLLRMIDMLAAAAIPGALVAMGLALNSYGVGGQVSAVAVVCGLKLIVMPVVAFLLARHVLALPPVAAGVLTVLAAMPVGANAYLFAAAYDRAPGAVSGAIAASTPLSFVTLSLLLLWLGTPAS